MRPLFETVTDISAGEDILRRRRYGVIEVVGGRLRRILLRPFPKIISAPEIVLFGEWYHNHRPGNRVRLYYNHPRRFPNFLALRYMVSSRQTRMATVTRSLEILEQIARLKRSDALLCDAGNWRLDARIMARFGWEPHCPSRWHRYYIKRFYGKYDGGEPQSGQADVSRPVPGDGPDFLSQDGFVPDSTQTPVAVQCD